jgi:uncharacterized protein (DUF983 family)
LTGEVAEPSTLRAAVLGLCPRCGAGKLFAGYLTVAPRCASCGLEYANFDAGDGPAVFVILIVGAIVAGGALIVILTFSLLRLMKAFLLVQQYKHQAHEGRRAD